MKCPICYEKQSKIICVALPCSETKFHKLFMLYFLSVQKRTSFEKQVPKIKYKL